MTSTFFGLTIASSGLSAYQIAANTTANNVANVQTNGYSRQVTNRVAAAALRVNAKYGTAGTGVEAISITQQRNLYYDTRYWNNNATYGLYETRYDYSKQIENYFIDDNTSTGFTTILNTVFGYMDTMKTDGYDESVRNQFISGAQSLATYFNTAAAGLSDIQSDVNTQVYAVVARINSIAEKISILNKQINVLEIQGGYANELRDARALLIDDLSQIVPTTVKEVKVGNSNDPGSYTGATEYTVTINGQRLVCGNEYYTLECNARTTKVNQSDIDGLYDIVWSSTGNSFNANSSSNSGILKGLLDIRDGNNGDYFHGTATYNAPTAATDNKATITVTNPSMTSEAKLTIAGESRLRINNTYYEYESFTAKYGADGTIESYTFTLKDVPGSTGNINGATAQIGVYHDYMGIPYYQAQLNEFVRNFCQAFNEMEQGTVTYKDLTTNEEFTVSALEFAEIEKNAAEGDIEMIEDNRGKYLDAGDKEILMGAFWVAKNMVNGEEMDLTDFHHLASTSNSYYQLTAANMAVIKSTVNDPTRFATSTNPLNGVDAYPIVEQLLTLQHDVVMYRGSGASAFLECMYADISVDTEEAKLFASNYEDVMNTIENQRLSVKGVDEDEEALDLAKFRNAYNLSSKAISILAEMYDRLILYTGV